VSDDLMHEQARRLIHAAADRSLSPGDRSHLRAHLAACPECRAYQAELDQLQSTLVQALRQGSNLHRPSPNIPQQITVRAQRAVRRSRQFKVANRITQLASVLVIALMSVQLIHTWDYSDSAVEGDAPAHIAVEHPGGVVRPAQIPDVEFEVESDLAVAGANAEAPALAKAPAPDFDPAGSWMMARGLMAK
jgi:anti-sigma factor RsiW